MVAFSLDGRGGCVLWTVLREVAFLAQQQYTGNCGALGGQWKP